MSLSVRVHSDTATTTAADFSNTAYYNTITLTNTSASAVLWVRLDGTVAVASADNNYPVLAGQTRSFRNHTIEAEPSSGVIGTTPVSAIASASCTFTIEFN
jgi:hypothetical protein